MILLTKPTTTIGKQSLLAWGNSRRKFSGSIEQSGISEYVHQFLRVIGGGLLGEGQVDGGANPSGPPAAILQCGQSSLLWFRKSPWAQRSRF